MDIEFFLLKQERILGSISTSFVREKYYSYLDSNERLLGLIGSRGVGKTTLLLQYLKKRSVNDYLYISADDIYVQNKKLYEIVESAYALGKRVIVVDEIHKYPNWAVELKNIYDSFFDLKLRFSGSSMLNILYEKSDLSRRAVTINVESLSFREYLMLAKGIDIARYTLEEVLKNHNQISKESIAKYPLILDEFYSYLKYGQYPFFLEGREFYFEKIVQTVEKIINEDIPTIARLEFAQVIFFRRLLYKLVEARVPLKVNISAISRELGVSEPTLYGYFDILKSTKILTPLKKFSQNISKKPEKLLFSNTNLFYAFCNEYRVEVNSGTLREVFFASCFDVGYDAGDELKKSRLYYSDVGDFRIDDYIFEIGGERKGYKQIGGVQNSFLVVDADFTVDTRKIPLWVFGLLG